MRKLLNGLQALRAPTTREQRKQKPIVFVSRETIRVAPNTTKPPLCKGRWHFRKKMTEGLLLTSLSSFCSLRSISQSLSLAFARQLPLHKGAFDTIKFCPCFLLAFSSSAEPILNHATIAWFSLYNKKGCALHTLFNTAFCGCYPSISSPKPIPGVSCPRSVGDVVIISIISMFLTSRVGATYLFMFSSL